MTYFETQRLIFRDWKEQDLKEFRIMDMRQKVQKQFQQLMNVLRH